MENFKIPQIIFCAVFCLGFITQVEAQKYKNPTNFTQVNKNAGENRRHKEDRDFWLEQGRKIGYEQGYQTGYDSGLVVGKQEGVFEALTSGLLNMDTSLQEKLLPLFIADVNKSDAIYKEIKKLNPDPKGFMDRTFELSQVFNGTFRRLDNPTQKILGLFYKATEAKAVRHAYDSIKDKSNYQRVYNEGYRKGRQTAYRIALKEGHNVVIKGDAPLPSNLDYIQMVKDIDLIQGSSLPNDAPAFSNLIRTIHEDMIAYLSVELSLSPEERKDALVQYDSIHGYLASQYYSKYLNIYKQWHIETDGRRDFYNYHFYYTTHALIDIIGWDLCSVSDVVLTYAKENSQYATTVGIETGSICWLLKEKYLQAIYANLLKAAFGQDLARVTPQMQSEVRSAVNSIVAETQIHEKLVTKEVELKEGEKAKITMKIITVYNVGFEQNEISVQTNFKTSNIDVNVSRKPRFMGIVHQYHEVISVETNKDYVEFVEKHKTSVSIKSTISGESPLYRKSENEKEKTATVVVDEKVFKKIFEANKPSQAEIMQDMKQLPLDAYQIIAPLIKKVVEPAISLPDANYKAKFNYGQKDVPLIRLDK